MWLRAENLKKLCGSNVTTAIYFYPENADCPDCVPQARELLAMKTNCPDSLWLFALPTDLNVTVVDMLKQRFGVATANSPSLVIDGQTTLTGLQTAAALRARFPAISNC